MRWSWATPILLVVLAFASGRAQNLFEAAHHGHTACAHSHGHWHDGDYHEHHHSHNEPVTEPLDDHAQLPHEHGWSDLPHDESQPTTLIVAPGRRDQWKPNRSIVALPSVVASAPLALDKPTASPLPRSRAGPLRSELTALRSIILQV